ncbi:hypothetical protein TWF281_007407 [Arthrobotrys megalospora]
MAPSNECPLYTETEEPQLLPPYQQEKEDLSSYELQVYEGIHTYYYGGNHGDGSIYLQDAAKPSSGHSWSRYTFPAIYATTILVAGFLHQRVLVENNMPYFLMAVYNTVATVVALICISYNYLSGADTVDTTNVRIHDMEINRRRQYISGRAQQQEMMSGHWKPFAFILLYMASEEGFWFSISSMPLLSHQATYLAYPLFVAFFTWEWVFAGKKERVVGGVSAEDVMSRLKVAVAMGGLGLCWSYKTSFEWWTCVVAVAMGAFKNVVTRDILMNSPHRASELVMLASSALSFRALMSCYSSAEYPQIWLHLTGLSWEGGGRVAVVGVCYGIAQVAGVEILREWEPVRGCWTVVVPAAVGVVGCLAFRI